MKRILKINEADNVAVAIADDVHVGDVFEGVGLLNDIPRGHKFALRDIKNGEPVIKYGYPIGRATCDIRRGEWIHSHNLATLLGEDLQYTYSPVCDASAVKKSEFCPTINGYLRADGSMGIRNEFWIVPTVGCVKALRLECGAEYVDDIRAFTHNYGCSQLGQDHANTRAALAALIKHPNAGGVLVLGLGCENNQMSALKESLGDYDESRVKFLVAQEVDDEIEAGFEIGRELIERMKADKRTPQPLSKLKVGLKCGGSDGLSGVTANPLVGLFSDWLIGCGGTTVLTEVPEMFGAEQLLMDRAKDEETFDKIVKLVNGFKEYYQKHDQPVYENPSPGNKAGGITTLEDKSLGCTQKSGSGEVCDVLFDGDALSAHGLNLLNGPGNDMVAVTNLASAGCHIVLFTTGRGTPFGGFVPTIKISTNSDLAKRKSNWIDFDAGGIAAGDSFEDKLKELIDLVVETANGKQTVNERYNSRDIAIFKSGVTL